MAILVLLEHLQANFDPNSECFAKYDAFCSLIFDYARLRHIAVKEVRSYGKIVYMKNIFENGW